MFENLQGINPMGLSASLANYKKTILFINEHVTNIHKTEKNKIKV